MTFEDILDDVAIRYRRLPAAVHAEDPHTVLSRIAANAFGMRRRDERSYERAATLAALAVALLVAIDRAETADIISGDEAA